MSLEGLIKEINVDAQKKTRALISQGNKEAKSLLKEADEKAFRLKEKASLQLKKEVEQLKKRERASMELEAKKLHLNARKELLQEAVEKAKERLSKSREKEKILKSLISRAKKELPSAKYVYSNKEDKALVQKLANGLAYRGTVDCLGGVVLEDKKGEVRVNYSYELLLEKILSQQLHEIAGRLYR